MKFIKVNNIKLSPDDNNEQLLRKAAANERIALGDIKEMRILKKSIDARKEVYVNYSVALAVQDHVKVRRSAQLYKEKQLRLPEHGTKAMKNRPIVIGTGSAGMFAALRLAEQGYKPIVLEQGMDIDNRDVLIQRFNDNHILDVNSNIQFGEGGAGTYSDGKLMSRNNSLERSYIYNTFVECGAGAEIVYDAHPHIGTDVLKRVAKVFRSKVESLGGEYRFGSKVVDFSVKNDSIGGVYLEDGSRIDSDCILLATGHSAREIYDVLHRCNVDMMALPFAIGLRIEHKRSMIDTAQYGSYAGNKNLGAAPYSLSYRSENRNVHSFCMCPGGVVVNAASEENSVCVNGMSYSKRDGENSNSAIVCRIDKSDFGDDLFSGIEYQRRLEKLAYIGDGDYSVPVQRLEDFSNNRISTQIGDIVPSVEIGYYFANLRAMLGEDIAGAIDTGIYRFGQRIKGFDMGDAVLSGIETRTSSPIRIVRGKDGQSNISGLYPIGEGAGYAGGILSSAVDGLRGADNVISKFAPLQID